MRTQVGSVFTHAHSECGGRCKEDVQREGEKKMTRGAHMESMGWGGVENRLTHVRKRGREKTETTKKPNKKKACRNKRCAQHLKNASCTDVLLLLSHAAPVGGAYVGMPVRHTCREARLCLSVCVCAYAR